MSTFMERDDRDLERWLEAEANGRLEDAEALFAGLLARNLPRVPPPGGFAAATVARAVALVPSPWPWWVRCLIAASVALAGIPLAWLQGLSPFDLVAGASTRLAPLAANLVSALHGAASMTASASRLFVLVGEAVLASCLTGPGPLIIVTNLALAVVGFLGLRRLLAPTKECW